MYRKGRKLGSSRRRQMREPADGQDALGEPGPESWSSEAETELQIFFRDCGAMDRGFVTREDLAVAKFHFLGIEEEPQMIFDWVDTERKGRLSLEEFSSGLRNIFGSSLSTHGLRRRRPPPSQRVSVTSGLPALEEASAEEREVFLTLLGQPGIGSSLPEQTEEIWQLWRKLRQEEPHLVGNLEGFLAKMSSRLQEARADKETLEQTLRKCDSDHRRKLQQLFEETEQQIQRQKQQLQAQSDSRGLALSTQMQEALEAKELEVQRLAQGQSELEAKLHSLSDTHREATSENLQLREARRDLAGQLEEMQGQLQVTREHLKAARGRVSWQVEEEASVPETSKKIPASQPEAPEEGPLPGLFGDSDNWDQLLSDFGSPWSRALQLTWSPPPTPQATSGSPMHRVVQQISISEPHLWPDQEVALRSPPRLPPSPQDGKGEDASELDVRPEQPVGPRGSEPGMEPVAGPQAGSPWGLLGAPAQESGSVVAEALRVLVPVEDTSSSHSPPQLPLGLSERLQASDDIDSRPGPAPAKLPRQREAPQAKGAGPGLGSLGAAVHSQGLEPVGQTPQVGPELDEPSQDGQDSHPGGLEEAQRQPLGLERLPSQPLQSPEEEPQAGKGTSSEQESAQPAPMPAAAHAKLPQAEAPLAMSPAPGEPFPAGLSGPTEPQVPPKGLPTLAEPKAPLRPQPEAAQAERQPGEPGVEIQPLAPGSDPSPGHSAATRAPQANPDYLFHIIFLGDSNVGKTSFLHLLHQDAFASGLAATVGVDFRVKTLQVDNKCFMLQLWDTAGQERYHSVTRQLLHKADGVVLMYDITSQDSFAHVRYWLDCLQDAGVEGAALLLLGNKTDCEEARQVPTEAGQQLAQELGVSFGECSAILGHNILEPMVNLARLLKVQEDRLKDSLAKVAPRKPPKKAGCCP
uniref:RAB44, member RAS onco family n=1 Tax=Cavia porcellus TaxID=10141 RepID=A0A286XX51_CAVPO|nr:ras-related protein Rab-44 isoform X1 [Cavia porcellus]